eukprot:1067318-Rhodomonas_salina.1
MGGVDVRAGGGVRSGVRQAHRRPAPRAACHGAPHPPRCPPSLNLRRQAFKLRRRGGIRGVAEAWAELRQFEGKPLTPGVNDGLPLTQVRCALNCNLTHNPSVSGVRLVLVFGFAVQGSWCFSLAERCRVLSLGVAAAGCGGAAVRDALVCQLLHVPAPRLPERLGSRRHQAAHGLCRCRAQLP